MKILALCVLVASASLAQSPHEPVAPAPQSNKILGIALGEPITQIARCSKAKTSKKDSGNHQPPGTAGPCWELGPVASNRFNIYGIVPSKKWPWHATADVRGSSVVKLSLEFNFAESDEFERRLVTKYGLPESSSDFDGPSRFGLALTRKIRIWTTPLIQVEFSNFQPGIQTNKGYIEATLKSELTRTGKELIEKKQDSLSPP